MVNITNTCKALIDKANPIWNGSIFPIKRTEGRKPCYRTQINGIEKVKAFLEEILNDLICKRRQAELVIEFCRIRIEKKTNSGHAVHGCCSYGEGYGEREFEILKEIRLLNVPKAGYHKPEFYAAIEQRVSAFKEGYENLNHAELAERKCEFCGKQFKIKAHKLTYKGQKTGTYCNTTCRGYAWKAKQLGLSFEEARVKWIDKLKPLISKHEDKIFSE